MSLFKKISNVEVTMPRKAGLLMDRYRGPLSTMFISAVVTTAVTCAGDMARAAFNIKKYDVKRKVLEHDEYMFTEDVNIFTQARESFHPDQHDLEAEQEYLMQRYFEIEHEKKKKKNKKKKDDDIIGNGGHIHD